MTTSYLIPEEILGVPLFVPGDWDFFSLETAGLPNGEDCYKVLGATNRTYKAYQDAQATTPAIFTSRSAGFSMAFWFKGGNLTTGAGYYPAQTLFSVHTAAWNGDWSTTGANQSYGSSWEHLWSVTHYAAGTGARCGIGWSRTRSAAGPSGALVQQVGVEFTQNVWHLITFNCPDTTAPTAFVDDNVSGSTGSAISGGVGLQGGLKLCLGGYSSSVNGRDGDWYIGKLAFYDHSLNATERSTLYHTMIP